jgi:hypothetical protein
MTMDYRKLLSPRFWLDKAASRAWCLLSSDLPRPDREPALDDPRDLLDISIGWPNHYGWDAFFWMDSIRSGLSRYVPVRPADIPQLPNTAVRVHLYSRGRKYNVIIDYSDYHETIVEEYLRDCLIYFKMQFRNRGYDDSRIVPGQYVPSDVRCMYRHLPRLRRIRDASKPEIYDVYGRFGLYPGSSSIATKDDVRNKRMQAFHVLREQNRFRYEGGGKLIELFHSLREVARSKVCLDLPGRGPFCFRLIDYLSIGACIVAYPHEATLYPPLVPGKHIAYCRPDFSDLVDLCHHYLTHDQERLAMIKASRDYFDAHLHKDCIAAYYLESCIRSMASLSASKAI